MSEFSGIDISQSTQVKGASNAWELPSTKEETTKSNSELSFDDMLMLMVTQLQNQTIDNQVDTNDMMNQLIQMTVMQAMTEMTSQVEELTTANIMSYSASLVGKEVTVGVLDSKGNLANEIVGTVTATGTYNGQQVIFIGDKYYPLSSIMSVGRLPETAVDGSETTQPTEPGDGEDDKTEGAEGSEGTTTDPDNTTNPDEGAQQAASDSGISAQNYNVEAHNVAAATQNRTTTTQRTTSVTSQTTQSAASVQSGEASAQAQEEDAGVPNWLFENGSPAAQSEESSIPSWLLSQGEQAVASGVPSWLVGPDA